jgi:hypothetical protein
VVLERGEHDSITAQEEQLKHPALYAWEIRHGSYAGRKGGEAAFPGGQVIRAWGPCRPQNKRQLFQLMCPHGSQGLMRAPAKRGIREKLMTIRKARG